MGTSMSSSRTHVASGAAAPRPVVRRAVRPMRSGAAVAGVSLVMRLGGGPAGRTSWTCSRLSAAPQCSSSIG